MAREDPQMKIRLDEALKDSIEAASRKAGRTLNAEVVARLRESLDEARIFLPDVIRTALGQEAKKNGRPLESEVFWRLSEGLKDQPEVDRLKQLLEEERQQNAALRIDLEAAFTDNRKRSTMLYVLLDTNGYPISWAEIHEHLAGIRSAGGFDPREVHTDVITPDLVSSEGRAQKAATIANEFRRLGQSVLATYIDDVAPRTLPDRKAKPPDGKATRRTRKPEQAGVEPAPTNDEESALHDAPMAHYDIVRRVEHLVPDKRQHQRSKGPVPSPNARKPKP